jgi:hypothetical protein
MTRSKLERVAQAVTADRVYRMTQRVWGVVHNQPGSFSFLELSGSLEMSQDTHQARLASTMTLSA